MQWAAGQNHLPWLRRRWSFLPVSQALESGQVLGHRLSVSDCPDPLVIAVRPWIDQHGRAFTLLFGVVDGLFVIVAIVLVC
jgi:hypothetical protein